MWRTLILLAVLGCEEGVAPPTLLDLSAASFNLSNGDIAGCRLETQTCGGGQGECCPQGDVMCSGGICVGTLP